MKPKDTRRARGGLAAAGLLLAALAQAEVQRVVIVKLDGVPGGLVAGLMAERDERTGKSRLPWMQEVFGAHGVRVQNFYTRGISLSVPSWSLLDTGQHLQIRGNAEYDRYTQHVYDYLNFFPFYVSYSLWHEVDMPGVEVLDDVGVPLLVDRFASDESLQGFQLFQRGVRWQTLRNGLQHRFQSRSPRELFDEWQTGFDMRSAVGEETERELIAGLANPKLRYLDYFSGDYDHTAHLTNDGPSQWNALLQSDALIGRVWTAIQNSPLGAKTALIVVSDHGMNTSERVYSQGYSLIDLLRSAAGGGHHVVTNRHPLEEYKLRGLNPFVSNVTTASVESLYLKDQSSQYPTALLDLDGNERANVYLRNSDLNALHILLQQIARTGLSPAMRRAAIAAVLAIVERHRPEWQATLDGLTGELGAVREKMQIESPEVAKLPKRPNKSSKLTGADKEARRRAFRLDLWKEEQRGYSAYLRTLSTLLALTPERLAGGHWRVEELIAPEAMGDRNTIGQLQNYVVGPAAEGVQLRADGELDMERSFRRINYFALLCSARVRNNVQAGVGAKPVDWVAVRVPAANVAGLFSGESLDDAIWIYAADDRQLLILSRVVDGARQFRLVPAASLLEDANGALRFTPADWRAGMPLHLWEDARLAVPQPERERWLSQWHTEAEWMRATHLTEYSNAVIGLYEELARNGKLEDVNPPLLRYAERKRRLAEADMLVLASDHWNFNARGFNPGGNHGSFFRISTHSILLIAGGKESGIPQGLEVSRPYDSLSLVPTVLTLLGRPGEARKLPGPVIEEVTAAIPTAEPQINGRTP